MLIVASCAFKPFTRVYPCWAPCLAAPNTGLTVSSMSSITVPSDPARIPGTTSANPISAREATASSWRTCPKVNPRRNVPRVEGARTSAKTLSMPPWRSRSRSSMLSAPASIPATNDITTPEPGANPAQVCANSANVIIAQISVGGVVVEAFPLAEPGDMSRGACVSTLTRGELTTAAYVANCKVLENGFAMANPSGRPYPYAFYGDPDLTAKNRAGCVALLRMFHTSIV